MHKSVWRAFWKYLLLTKHFLCEKKLYTEDSRETSVDFMSSEVVWPCVDSQIIFNLRPIKHNFHFIKFKHLHIGTSQKRIVWMFEEDIVIWVWKIRHYDQEKNVSVFRQYFGLSGCCYLCFNWLFWPQDNQTLHPLLLYTYNTKGENDRFDIAWGGISVEKSKTCIFSQRETFDKK